MPVWLEVWLFAAALLTFTAILLLSAQQMLFRRKESVLTSKLGSAC